MKRRSYTFVEPPTGQLFADVLAAGLERATMVCLIMFQSRTHLSPRTVRALDTLQPHLLRTEEVTQWPGSELMRGYHATRHVYRFDASVAALIHRTAPALLDWKNPALPDDPHLLRRDATTWLGSSTTEQDAWLELSDAEWEALNMRWPLIADVVHRDELPATDQ